MPTLASSEGRRAVLAGSRARRRPRSAIGLAIDAAGRDLYAAQNPHRPAIRRIELANPTNVTTHASPGSPAASAALDGITIDAAARLHVAANAAGQIRRVDTDGTICAAGYPCNSGWLA